MVEQHNLDTDSGNGSRSKIQDMYDSEEYVTKDQRADTRTTFYEKDINELNVSERRKKRLRRALRRQEGEDYGEGTSKDKTRRQRKQQNREEWKRRVITTYASQLDMSRSQKERAKHLFMDVLQINTFGPYSAEKVALGVINVVAREYGWTVEDNEKFHELMVKNDMTIHDPEDDEYADKPSMETMKKLRCLVRERVPSMVA